MAGHKFHMGQLVRFVRDPSTRVSSLYEVKACLPAGADGPFIYRIKGGNEDHERMVREHELVRAVRPTA